MSEITFIKYETDELIKLQSFGLDLVQLRHIFTPESNGYIDKFAEGMPQVQRSYYLREDKAALSTFNRLINDSYNIPHPFRNETVSATQCCFPHSSSTNIVGLPLFYYFDTQPAFYIANAGLSGRPSYVYVPTLKLLIHDTSLATAKAIHEVFVKQELAIVKRGKLTLMIDMVMNYAHQLINHLSALFDLEILSQFDEVWIGGADFFGSPQLLMPALSQKIRFFLSKEEMYKSAIEEKRFLVRHGRYIMPELLKQRVLAISQSRYGTRVYDRPIITVTVRASGRACVNLPTVVEKLYNELIAHVPDLGIILDGWNYPESGLKMSSPAATVLLSSDASAVRLDLDLARSISSRLPRHAIVATTIGMSVLESLAVLRSTQAYFAHIGTPQHKLGFLIAVPGVVHGPKAQLIQGSPGSYQSENSIPPILLDPAVVEDHFTNSHRGEMFNDYSILAKNNICEILRRCLLSGNAN